MNILSFNPQKIIINPKDKIVFKKTLKIEYEQITLAHNYFASNPIILDCGLKVKTAPIIGFENDTLFLDFCEGINMEHLLKYGYKKKLWIYVLKELMNSFKKRGFLWGDIAPRNIVFNKKENVLYIFDFEKKTIIKDITLNDQQFSNFFRNYAYEEFSCFLTKKEQDILFYQKILKQRERAIYNEDIFSGRKRFLLQNNFNKKNFYSTEEVAYIEDQMSFAATPIIIDNKILYPMFLIEKITEKGGYYEYSKIVNRLCRCANDFEKFNIIKEFI